MNQLARLLVVSGAILTAGYVDAAPKCVPVTVQAGYCIQQTGEGKREQDGMTAHYLGYKNRCEFSVLVRAETNYPRNGSKVVMTGAPPHSESEFTCIDYKSGEKCGGFAYNSLRGACGSND